MTSDTAIAPEILTDDQIEDLQLELELARPARVKIPATGALADHDDKMRAGARNFLRSLVVFDETLDAANRDVNHATEVLRARKLANAKRFTDLGLMGDNK